MLSRLTYYTYKGILLYILYANYSHKIKKGDPYTHTRIGDKSLEIYGGAYFISISETKAFQKLYLNEIFKKNGKEYLTFHMHRK